MSHEKSINAAPFGTLLGYAPGNVAVYSSDYDTASDEEFPKRSAFRSYLDGIYMGYKWQCVEFARRWMYINKGYIFDDISMAFDIFELRSVRDINTNTRLPLHAFRNGSRRHPEPGCLLIWAEGGEFEDTGHVAVVTDVQEDHLLIAEQNVGHVIWPAGQNYSRKLRAKITEDGDYWLECSYNDASILGWVIQTDDAEHAEPADQLDGQLLNLQPREAENRGQAHKAWLNIANEDEAAYVEMMHGHKLTSVDSDQYRYYAASLSAEHELEHATNELHGLFMHATDYVLENEELLEKFNLPRSVLSKIRQSWDNRLNQLITSRFDFSMSAQGLKVYEYNCDSASCFMECAKIQGKWARHFGVDEGKDPGSDLFADLVRAWKKSNASDLLHILRDDDAEEKYHALFMQDTLKSAGIRCRIIVGLEGLVWDADGNIRDPEGEQVKWVWKTWAWETALDQIREECEDEERRHSYEPRWKTGDTPRLSDVLLRKNVMVFEPLWTLIPSNKAILPVLWSLFPNHPLLLNTSFELTDDLVASGYVSKPIVGRCGQNIQIIDRHDDVLESSAGNFDNQEHIYQQLFPLPKVGDYFVQVSTFTAAGAYSGTCLRVDSSMIIGKNSDCMALRFVNDKALLASINSK
ncbi:MAG: bifunctional glutathionylspermidine amidase/synthase [Hahellaceae bacterium]|nr:bifunctional glutathionylspermidine amidase/synthase [Hahellaceae bacterium]MCP5209812.1 bifunctional glutathionylspermidine amidase/synthase [Hahellaceae bacterium]